MDREAIKAKLGDVAKAAGWRYFTDEDGMNDLGQMEVEPGYRIWFQESRERGQVAADVNTGIWPDANDKSRMLSYWKGYNESISASIRFNPEKSVSAIVRDLQTRLEPEGRKILARLWERYNDHVAFQARLDANAERVKLAFGAVELLKMEKRGGSDATSRTLHYYNRETYNTIVDFEVRQDSVEIKLDLPVDAAVAVTLFLSRFLKEKKEAGNGVR